MKKKVLIVALAVALIAIMVGGSLAYFTDQDKVTNTFTVGSVKIEIYENGNPTDRDEFEFGKLTPIVNTENPNEDTSYIEKTVKVNNVGLNSAYIRTHIAVPTALIGYLYLDLDESGWTRQADSTVTVDGVAYTVFTYDYDAAVAAGDATSILLQGVYLASDVDLEENDDGDLVFVKKTDGVVTHNSGVVAHTKNDNGSYTSATIKVLVASQAIQSEGFESSTPTAALNSGFTTNPWAN